MRLPRFRLQSLFMIVLICAAFLVSVESLMTHRRERKALSRIVGMQKLIGTIQPSLDGKDRDLNAMREVAKKHGLEAEMIEATVGARMREERDQKAKADEVATLPK